MTKKNIDLHENVMDIETLYQRWIKKSGSCQISDPDVIDALEQMKGKEDEIEEAFYRDLAFGTGGIRGIIGAGPNRMNIHTVARVSQGLANYITKKYKSSRQNAAELYGCRIAVSYDSRIKSHLFAQIACQVFAGNGIKAYLYPRLMPTPCLSFAVRHLKCDAGVMVTASHNPCEYNGYKVYGADGCQITVSAADEIYKEIEKIDIFDDIKIIDFETGLKQRMIEYISSEVYTAFIEAVMEQSVIQDICIKKDIPIVYSPLNGTGLEPVLRILRENGFTNITVVREQEKPDGNFPTCPYPNPEIEETLALGIEYAKKRKAALMLATDPDCDRVGVAVRDAHGKYVLLSGNETGILLFDYICNRRNTEGTMPKSPVMIKTIVTTDLSERIAERYGVETLNVLTGFKFIGEQIHVLEKEGRTSDFIFGFEESCGFLSGSYVRDKDGVGAAFLICEMCSYYASLGLTLTDKLDEIYKIDGFCMNSLHTYKFPGIDGSKNLKELMHMLRRKLVSLGGMKVEKIIDYNTGINGLPKSNMLKFLLGGGCWTVIRPSGTEPKLKVYISICAKSKKEALRLESEIVTELRMLIMGR